MNLIRAPLVTYLDPSSSKSYSRQAGMHVPMDKLEYCADDSQLQMTPEKERNRSRLSQIWEISDSRLESGLVPLGTLISMPAEHHNIWTSGPKSNWTPVSIASIPYVDLPGFALPVLAMPCCTVMCLTLPTYPS